MNCLINYPQFHWSINYTIEQVFLCLIKATENDGITRKYEKRIRWLIRRFNIWKPSPEVIIYRKDLSKRVYDELVQLQKEFPDRLDYVMTRAIEMIFECITEAEEPIFNNDYYLFSVKRNKSLRWRFDRKDDQELDPDSKYEIKYPLYTSECIEIGATHARHSSSPPAAHKKKIGVFHQIVI